MGFVSVSYSKLRKNPDDLDVTALLEKSAFGGPAAWSAVNARLTTPSCRAQLLLTSEVVRTQQGAAYYEATNPVTLTEICADKFVLF